MWLGPDSSGLKHIDSVTQLPGDVVEAVKAAVSLRAKQQSTCLSVEDMGAIAVDETSARGFAWTPKASWLKALRAELGMSRKRRK